MEHFTVEQHRPGFTDTHVAMFCLGQNGRPLKHRVTILAIYRDEEAEGKPVIGYLIPNVNSLRDLGSLGVSPNDTTHIRCNMPATEMPLVARTPVLCHLDSVIVDCGDRGKFVMPPGYEYQKGVGFVRVGGDGEKSRNGSSGSGRSSTRA